jgi:hypothetical protein
MQINSNYVIIIIIFIVLYIYYKCNCNNYEQFSLESITGEVKKVGNWLSDHKQGVLEGTGTALSIIGAATCWTGVGCALVPAGMAVSALAATDGAYENIKGRHEQCLKEVSDINKDCIDSCVYFTKEKDSLNDELLTLNGVLYPNGGDLLPGKRPDHNLSSDDVSYYRDSIKEIKGDIEYNDTNYKGCNKYCVTQHNNHLVTCKYSKDWKNIMADVAVAGASIALSTIGGGGAGSAAKELGKEALKEGGEQAAKLVLKEGGEEIVKGAAKKTSKNIAFRGGKQLSKDTLKSLAKSGKNIIKNEVKESIKSLKDPKAYLEFIKDNAKDAAALASLADPTLNYSAYLPVDDYVESIDYLNTTPKFDWGGYPDNLTESGYQMRLNCPKGADCQQVNIQPYIWPDLTWLDNDMDDSNSNSSISDMSDISNIDISWGSND